MAVYGCRPIKMTTGTETSSSSNVRLPTAEPVLAARSPDEDTNFQKVRNGFRSALRELDLLPSMPYSIGHYELNASADGFDLGPFNPKVIDDRNVFATSRVEDHALRQLVWYNLEMLGLVDLYRQHRKELIDDRPRPPYVAVVYYGARNPHDPRQVFFHVDADGEAFWVGLNYNNSDRMDTPESRLNAPEMDAVIDEVEKHYPPLLIRMLREARETLPVGDKIVLKTLEPNSGYFSNNLMGYHASPNPRSRALATSVLQTRLKDFMAGPRAEAAQYTDKIFAVMADAEARGVSKVYKDELLKAEVPEALCDELWAYFAANPMDTVDASPTLKLRVGEPEPQKRLEREKSGQLDLQGPQTSNDLAPSRDFIAILVFP
jgi:hypothetical protein